MTHFWVTAPTPVLRQTVFRYYVDGEEEASIEFIPSMACGVGSFDPQAPWGTKWFGKGAKDGAWFLNFKIPFQKSIRITVQHLSTSSGGFYLILRGAPNLPISIGGVTVPATAKLLLQKVRFLDSLLPDVLLRQRLSFNQQILFPSLMYPRETAFTLCIRYLLEVGT